MLTLTRRRLLQASAAGLLVPRLPRAGGISERKFLFVIAYGGWDPCAVFAPLFDSSIVDMPGASTAAEIGGLPLVDSESRPSVRSFFESYGDRSGLINGMAVDALGHSLCARLLLTASSDLSAPDWGSLIAGHSVLERALPMFIVSGPSYPGEFSIDTARLGSAGQLGDLLTGDALTAYSDVLVSPPTATVEELESAFVQARAERHLSQASAGRESVLAAQTLIAESRLSPLKEELASMDLSVDSSLTEQLLLAVDLLASGTSRCAQVTHGGVLDMGWDTHINNEFQSSHFDELFTSLGLLMEALDGTQGEFTDRLSDEIVVVVLSEMGRFPILNSQAGKDHWVYTSALLVGGGIQGGQVVGGFDDNAIGLPIDLTSGQPIDAGERLTSAHLGATLLALADVDPYTWTGVDPIEALL